MNFLLMFDIAWWILDLNTLLGSMYLIINMVEVYLVYMFLFIGILEHVTLCCSWSQET